MDNSRVMRLRRDREGQGACSWGRGRDTDAVTAATAQPSHIGAQLILVAGMIGVGKSSLADAIGARLRIPVLAVDRIEAAMQAAGISERLLRRVAAYQVTAALALAQLRVGLSVVVDAVCAHEAPRQALRHSAAEAGVRFTVIEVTCSDQDIQRQRLASRVRDMPGYPEPTWEYVVAQRQTYAPWTEARLNLDSIAPLATNLVAAIGYIQTR